ALKVADELEQAGISCEVIDLRSILPLDYETVMNSIAKTNRVVVAQEANLRGGLASDIVAEIVDRGFDLLDSPPVRVGAPNVPMPYNSGLEKICIPDEGNIKDAVYKSLSND
ncbi:MAG: transketolase C-terminal domain-containing protein, partial [Clostridia bacterium]|nr:transketolase C-terminal domain-containing protein [Clostridia bacterium]